MMNSVKEKGDFSSVEVVALFLLDAYKKIKKNKVKLKQKSNRIWNLYKFLACTNGKKEKKIKISGKKILEQKHAMYGSMTLPWRSVGLKMHSFNISFKSLIVCLTDTFNQTTVLSLRGLRALCLTHLQEEMLYLWKVYRWESCLMK